MGKLRHVGLGWELAGLADGQHGVVGWRQLIELGVPERTIEEWIREGRLHRVHRGVFAVGHPRIAEAGRRWAAVLAYGKGALLSHRTAAAIWGLGSQRSPLIDVTAPAGRQGVQRRDRIFIHRGRLHPEDRARGYGRRALKPIRRLLAEARATMITRSPLEDDFAAFCRVHRLPVPSFNTTVLGYEVDAVWPAQRLASRRASSATPAEWCAVPPSPESGPG